MRIHGFPPIESPDSEVLILGSMPSVASLRANAYYAHPRNRFWRVAGELFGAGIELPYAARVEQLQRRGIAVWDVVRSCVRKGSLDTAIDEATIVVNDFSAFLAQHPRVRKIFFNGAKAEAAFARYVLPTLRDRIQTIEFTRLPSTSPANAAMTLAKLVAAWRVVSV